MRRTLGVLVGAFVGMALAYEPAAYFSCRAAPSNLCGLGGALYAPFGLIIGAFLGGWLAGPTRRTPRPK
jgi:hypothetical protein